MSNKEKKTVQKESINETKAPVDTPVETELNSINQDYFNALLSEEFNSIVLSHNVFKYDQLDGKDLYVVSRSKIMSPGKGLVVKADSSSLKLKFQYVYNGQVRTEHLSLNHIKSHLNEGDTVQKGRVMAHALPIDSSLGYRSPAGPSYSFSAQHNLLLGRENLLLHRIGSSITYPIPKNIASLIIIDKSNYHFYWYKKGVLKHDFPIALGQSPEGHKVQQGDNRTPEGEYTIVEKLKGPFNSPTGPWLGNSWFRLNYPNQWDAEKAYQSGLITKAQRDAIVSAFKANRDTPNNTKLGGHIGIHGWNGDWFNYSTHDITWGCVSMRNHQIDDIYDDIPVGTKVYIIP